MIKKSCKLKYLSLLLLVIFLFLSSCSQTHKYIAAPITLTIAHLNDTHSHLESDRDIEALKFDSVDTKVFLGGCPRLKTALNKIKSEANHFMLLHAGDAVQGTLYFTLFNGDADIECLNLLGIDAMALGNHEFDKGTTFVAKFIDKISFPIIAANIDFTQIPSIAKKVQPYMIKNYSSERVAIIGLTTEKTAEISNPGADIKFNDVRSSTAKTIEDLKKEGINKIIVVSHIGYDEDKKLGETISGIDIIVGGHSHTLLGDAASFGLLGMKPEGRYPTVVKAPDGKDVLIVQAWRWGGMIGLIEVDFDEMGDIKGYSKNPVLILGPTFIQDNKEIPQNSDKYERILEIIKSSAIANIYEEDRALKNILQPYKKKLDELMNSVIAKAKDNLIVGLNSGPGPLIADSMAWMTGAQIALLNRGGVRRDIYRGDISVGTVMEVLPFSNTLFLIEFSGSDIKAALEEGIDFQLSYNFSNPLYPYVSGMTYAVNKSSPKGERVVDIKVKNSQAVYEPLNMRQSYKLVTNSYIASKGGDGYASLRDFSGYKYDTGLLDFEVFIEYLKHLKVIFDPKDDRITIRTQIGLNSDFRVPIDVQNNITK